MVMMWRSHIFLIGALVQVLAVAGLTNTDDFAALNALKSEWANFPPNWNGADPCGDGWDGISCRSNRVVSITLSSINLTGQIPSDIGRFSALLILDLSYNPGLTGTLPPGMGSLSRLTNLILIGCGFSGQIPSSIGSLRQLVYLSLNKNNFIGEIPPSIGNLARLYWLDLADNRLTGSIPVSDGSTPGLDMLLGADHFHFGNNQLSGEIPPQLFSSSMSLHHLLFENNRLTGTIPSTLGLVQTLEVIRLDGNSLNGSVPENINNLTNVQDLYLANNQLTGILPNLTGMNLLNYVDMSNNSFDPTDIPSWFSSIASLTSLYMENTQIQGELPVSLFSTPQLQTVVLNRNPGVNGTLNIGPNPSSQLSLIDLQGNSIDFYTNQPGYSFTLVLVGNPVCTQRARESESYCSLPRQSNSSYSTPAQNCRLVSCSSNRVSSPNCTCAYPYTGILVFRSPSFSNFENATIFESLHKELVTSIRSNGLPVESVALSNPIKYADNYLLLNLQVFPSGQDYFNHTGISTIGFLLSNQTFKPPRGFGPFFFIGNIYPYFAGLNAGHKSNIGIIIGAAAGGAVLFLLLLLAGVYVFWQKRRAETAAKKNNPFATWDPNSNSGAVPQLKGAKYFSFEELKKYTDNFSEANYVGSGGYGKVYRGIHHGQMFAIKRAQLGSIQGGLEFKTEIELLSRVHHKNVISLVGFCFDEGEQMLVYEYVVNGTLKDSLSGKSGIRLDWMRRLRIAIGAARGIQYLHDLANPPIIHRDIKSNNILLDECLNAKVADFGLCKPKGESPRGHVTTQVKGTMGYLDPEYYMTQQLSEKSDVYSFGVLLLEILTSRTPIEKGKYIVREVKVAMDRTKAMYNLHRIIDPIIGSNALPRSIEKFVDVALRCVEESGVDRPPMSKVVKEIESIMELVGLNPNAESASTSTSYENASKGSNHPYSNENLMAYSGAFSPANLEFRTQGDLYGSRGHL